MGPAHLGQPGDGSKVRVEATPSASGSRPAAPRFCTATRHNVPSLDRPRLCQGPSKRTRYDRTHAPPARTRYVAWRTAKGGRDYDRHRTRHRPDYVAPASPRTRLSRPGVPGVMANRPGPCKSHANAASRQSRRPIMTEKTSKEIRNLRFDNCGTKPSGRAITPGPYHGGGSRTVRATAVLARHGSRIMANAYRLVAPQNAPVSGLASHFRDGRTYVTVCKDAPHYGKSGH